MILLASVSSGILAIWPSHLVIPHVMVPFDSQQLSQTPLVEGVDLEYISLGDCPALRTIQEDR